MKSYLILKLSSVLASPKVTTLDGRDRKGFVYKWARPEYWVVLLLLSGTVLSSRGLRDSSLSLVMFLSVFGYVAVCFALNRTIVEIVNGKLFVKHRPVPWPGNRAIPVEDIRSVYFERIESTRRRHIYNIRIITRNGKALRLVGSLYEEDITQSLVKQLKKWLLLDREFE